MKYILAFGEDEYIESYLLGTKEVSTTDVKGDALIFHSKSEAEWIADRLVCDIEEV